MEHTTKNAIYYRIITVHYVDTHKSQEKYYENSDSQERTVDSQPNLIYWTVLLYMYCLESIAPRSIDILEDAA